MVAAKLATCKHGGDYRTKFAMANLISQAALSHRVGKAVWRSYNRTDLFDRQRPLMTAWAHYVCGDADSNVGQLKRGVA